MTETMTENDHELSMNFLMPVDHRLPESAYIDVQLHSRWTGIARDDEIYDVHIAIRDFIYDCDSTGVTFYGR